MTADHRPRAAAYQRISHIAEMGDEHGVTNQLDDQQRVARMRGYTIVMSETDNDLGALHGAEGKRRPGYERIMAAVQRGEIDVILVFQTSRFTRNREERARAIKILQRHGVSIIATRGPSLDMSNAYGRAMAGLLGEFDTMESEVKGERQQMANEAAARAGKPRKAAPRPFGWQADRRTLELAEASAVADGCVAILRGGTVSGVMRDWARRAHRSPQSPFGPLDKDLGWTRTSVRQILTSPRIAGIMTYRRAAARDEARRLGVPAAADLAELGPGDWQPIVSEETLRAVQWTLAQRRRAGQSATSLLGHLALCWCGNYISATVNTRGQPSYRCNQATRNGEDGPHVHVRRDGPDEHVSAAAVAWLSQADVAQLVIAPADDDASALLGEETVIHARLAQLGSMFMDGRIAEADVTSGRARGEERLAEIHARLAQIGRQSALTPLVLAEDTAAAWGALDVARRRAVIGELMTVTLYPAGAGRRFDAGTVLPPGRGIAWKV